MSSHLHVMSIPVFRSAVYSYTPQTNEERLFLASAKGELETVEEMLDAGVDIGAKDIQGKIARLFNKWDYKSGKTALHFACLKNQVAVARGILERAKKEGRLIVDLPDSYMMPPLTDAIANNAHGCVDLLLENGSDIRKFPPVPRQSYSYYRHFWDNSIGRNPLIFAIYHRKVVAVEKLLCSVGNETIKPILNANLLPFLCADLIKIVASYCLGNCEEYLNNLQNFNISPLRLANRRAEDMDVPEVAGDSQKIVELLIEFGATDEVREPPTKKQKTAWRYHNALVPLDSEDRFL